jgi:hypothetical protein
MIDYLRSFSRADEEHTERYYLPDDFVTLHRPTKVTVVVVRFSCARAVLSMMPALPRNERNYVSLCTPRN